MSKLPKQMRLCPYCKQWFFPKRSNSATCGKEECQKAHQSKLYHKWIDNHPDYWKRKDCSQRGNIKVGRIPFYSQLNGLYCQQCKKALWEPFKRLCPACTRARNKRFADHNLLDSLYWDFPEQSEFPSDVLRSHR